jgi:hypothetical protein
MSITATTFSAAVGTNDTTVTVASATGITAPNFTTGVGITYLFAEQEYMLVVGVNGLSISVQRGISGSPASAHAASCPVISGLPSDFSGLPISIKAQQDFYPNNIGWSAPVVSANTITPTGPYFHMTGTTIVKTINPVPGSLEGGFVTIVFDGSGAGLTWDATGNIAVAGTSTTAASAVTFVFDQGSGKWHPSRLA